MVNKVAQIIKYVAYVNVGISLLLATVYSEKYSFYSEFNFQLFFIVLIVGLVTSVFIYAFGEIIDLLQAIKNNTTTKSEDTTLPPL